MDAIRTYVQGAFAGVPESPEAIEQQEELVANLSDKVADLVAQGSSEEEALGVALASLGGLDALVQEFQPAEAAPSRPKPVEVNASRLALHASIAASAVVAVLLLMLSLLALSMHSFEKGHALLGAFALAPLAVWVAFELWRARAMPTEARSFDVGSNRRLAGALLVWLGLCALAFVANMFESRLGFWAWIVWGVSAAIPLHAVIERLLVGRGLLLAKTTVPAEVNDGARGERNDLLSEG